MTMEELDARLRTIERLLTILVAHPDYRPAIEEMRALVYAEVGQQLNRMFPSDPGYSGLKLQSDAFEEAVRTAEALPAGL